MKFRIDAQACTLRESESLVWSLRRGRMFRKVVFLAILLIPILIVAQKNQPAPGPTPVQGKLTEARAGVYYSDLVVGTGTVAERGKRVTVHYTGWLTDGTKFDSSVGRRPFTFELGAGDVIRGWDVGVEGMRVGGKRQLQIPFTMAYGPSGRPPVIPPYAELIFEVELLDVAKK
jgi:FKBP-type peptidyl-prolyl cis-trans isomerase